MTSKSVDVLIVGGGLAGCATAYFLACEGVEATVIERTSVNAQASGKNAGSIHVQIPPGPFLVEGEGWAQEYAQTLPLMREAARFWAEMETRLGRDMEVTITGGILFAENDSQMRDVERKAAIERANGIAIELLGADEIRRLAPYASKNLVGGAYCPDEGKGNPLKATPAFAEAAAEQGADFLTGIELQGLETDGKGYIAHTSGGKICAKRIVNCAGAEAGHVAAMLGLNVPIEGYPIQLAVTEPIEPLITHLVYSAAGRLTLKQTRHGSLLIGGGWPAIRRESDGRLTVSLSSLRENMKIALGIVPALAGIKIVRAWPAIVNGTEDWKPILGETPGYPGFYLNLFPWMGFSAGPLSAFMIAELIIGRKPTFDLTAFSVARYG
jgi:sarcosine oxidase, subunit beta